jgi:hypothetical protein
MDGEWERVPIGKITFGSRGATGRQARIFINGDYAFQS